MEIPVQLSSLTPEALRAFVSDGAEYEKELQQKIETVTAAIEDASDIQALFGEKAKKKDLNAELTALKGKLGDAQIILASLDDEVEEAKEEVKTEDTTSEAKAEDEKVEDDVETTEEVKAEDTQDETVVSTEDENVDATSEGDVVTEVATEQTAGDEVVSETQEEVVLAASQKDGESSVEEKNQPSESGVSNGNITAAFHSIVDGAANPTEAIKKVMNRSQGGDAFKVVYEGEGVFNTRSNVDDTTDHIMRLGTPGREDELSFAQKQYASNVGENITAAFCQPPEKIDSDIMCGSYERTILNSLPRTILSGLEVEYFLPVDSSDEDFVGEVELVDDNGDDLDSIAEKACYEAECLTRVSKKAREIKACLTSNEQTAFTAPLAIQQLLSDGKALLAALGDQLLLDQMIEETFKFEYEATGAGYGEIEVAIAATMEALDRQSKITQVENLVAYVPGSLLRYKYADKSVAQFDSAVAREAGRDLLSGIGVRDVIVYDDALDSSNASPVPVLSKTVATELGVRTAWDIHLINPADAFVGLRNENEYSLEPVAQSIAEKRANRLSWFARAYELFARRGCSDWATISISDLCLGGRVIAAADCIGS